MQLSGFQKLSLIDYPGTIAATVFTQGCAFRCPYCHNPELIPLQPKMPSRIDPEQVFEYLQHHRGFLEGVCITGGEPTLQHDLVSFMVRLKSFGIKIKLDTSGVNPGMLAEIIERRLVDFIAMDLKHTWEKYDEVVRVHNQRAIDNCRKSFGIIQQSGIDHEFRTTHFPQSHTREDFIAMAGYLANGESYVIQKTRFIKTLDGLSAPAVLLNVDAVAEELRQLFPLIHVGVR